MLSACLAIAGFAASAVRDGDRLALIGQRVAVAFALQGD